MATEIEPVIVYEEDGRQKLFSRADELVDWLGSLFQAVSDDHSVEHERAGLQREEVLNRFDAVLNDLKSDIAAGKPRLSLATRNEAAGLVAAFRTVHPPTGKLP
ncbi:hypothetical protein [Inquilinus sp.]|jgi:hypothetical protein|uniref:hypothetical protein n=1 Tax=Inquilinus sp. TaxID=1932117 RepID=UPI003783F918